MLLALTAALAVASCGGDRADQDAAARGADATVGGWVEPLLARRTLERVGDVADYSPHPTEGFAGRSLGGWSHLTTPIAGRPAVQTYQGAGHLELTAGVPVDRVVSFAAIRGKGAAKIDGELELFAEFAGARFDLAPVTDTWRELSFDLPAALWQEGGNRLTLGVVDPTRWGEGLLAVTDVRVRPAALPDGPAADSERRGPGLWLGPNEATRCNLAGAAGGRIDIAFTARGDGELVLEWRALDTATGLCGDPSVGEVFLAESGARATATAVLPADLPPVARLELRWHPTDDTSDLQLERVDLVRVDPSPPRLVVFLSVDTLAAWNMSLHGYGRPTTRVLDSLAEHAIVFDEAIANCPWTLPSYISQFTAMLPNAHRITTKGEREDFTAWSEYQLADNRFTLAELFNAAGYETAGLVDNLFLAKLRGLRQGFERLDVTPSTRGHFDLDGGMKLVASTALEWIDDWDRDRPLFLFMQVLDVHGPYITSAPWRGTFSSDAATHGPLRPISSSMETAVGAVPEYVAGGLWRMGHERADEVPVGLLRDSYDEKILELDARVGAFLEALEARGLRDEVLFVLSADHGEITTQQEIYFRHGPVLEPSIHVPLLLDLPGDDAAGRRIDDPVSLIDLMPTLAELIGLDPAPFAFHGRSLVPLIEGGELPERPIAIQTTFRASRAIRYGGWKLVEYNAGVMPTLATALTHQRLWVPWAAAFPELARELAGRDDLAAAPTYARARFEEFERRHPEALDDARRFFRDLGPQVELYNLEQDPGELDECAARHPEKVAELQSILKLADDMTLAGALLARADDLAAELSASTLSELAALGYLDLDEAEPTAGDGD